VPYVLKSKNIKLQKELIDNIESSNFEGVEKVIESGVDLTKFSKDITHGLYRDGLFTKYREMVRPENATPIGFADFCKDRKVLELFIDNEVKAINKSDHFILIKTASGKEDYSSLDGLLSQGISINSEDEKGTTALEIFIQEGDVRAVRELIKRGADIHHLNSSGSTPLSKMVFRNQINPEFNCLVEEIFNSNQSHHIYNKHSFTNALNTALSSGNLDAGHLLLDFLKNLPKYEKKKFFDFGKITESGESFSYQAYKKQKNDSAWREIFEELRDEEAKVSIDLLYLCLISSGEVEGVKELLSKKFENINMCDDITPLQVAICSDNTLQNRLKMIREILKYHPGSVNDTSDVDDYDSSPFPSPKTPLDLSLAREIPQITSLLLLKGGQRFSDLSINNWFDFMGDDWDF